MYSLARLFYGLFCLFAALILSVHAGLAQDAAPTQEELPDTEIVYFKGTRKPSTVRVPFRSRSWHVYVLNRAGDTLYRTEDHQYSYQRTTTFHYYTDSAVKKLRHSWNPGGGIQWGYEIVEFSPEGEVTNTFKWENDNHRHLTNPVSPSPPTTTSPPNPGK